MNITWKILILIKAVVDIAVFVEFRYKKGIS